MVKILNDGGLRNKHKNKTMFLVDKLSLVGIKNLIT